MTDKSTSYVARKAERIAALRQREEEDLDRIREGLRQNCEDLAQRFNNVQPTRITGSEIRWWPNFGFRLTRSGRYRGRWSDHVGSRSGDMLSLIQDRLHLDFPGAKRWARSYLGLPEQERQSAIVAQKAVRPAQTDKQRIAGARRFWKECIPIAGTVAQIYLEQTRGIPRPLPYGWYQGVVRFHPRLRALVVAARDSRQDLYAIQMVRLTADGRKIPAPASQQDPLVKQTYGQLPVGAMVRLFARPGRASGPIQVAEGPETGFSVWMSTGYATWITLGGFSKIDLSTRKPLILCSDDDAPDSPAALARNKLIAALRTDGHTIGVATPWATPRGDRSDLNDVLLSHGAQAVAERIEMAVAALNAGQAAGS